ncbi:phosphoribosylformylglycinamidine synthase subunit PurQ [bacterium]
MNKPKVIILRSAGTNCDKETAYAFEALGAEVDLVHINKLFKKEVSLLDYHLLALPGGFSYGDDVSAGKVLANELKYKLSEDLKKFVESGRLVIGICNGFQVLIKTGLLPGIDGVRDNRQYATLTSNDSDKFECRWVYLKKVNNTSPFLKYVPDIINIPVAHAEGKFIPLDNSIRQKIEDESLVAFRYTDENGKICSYPLNPNGSINNIAGICNRRGNVLGMMPHPERFFHNWQSESWTEGEEREFGDGYYIFKGAIDYIREKFL